jgi:hypothetical protein
MMTPEMKQALESVLSLARTGANETFTNMTQFQKDMHDVLLVEDFLNFQDK